MPASDRISARPHAARDAASPRERGASLSDAVVRMQRTIGNAGVARLARAANARRLLARWPPDEEKVRVRAHEIWQRRGGAHSSQAESEADYYEAQRQVAIEERAHHLSEQRGGGDMVTNYYDAERDIAAERANGAPPKAPPPPPRLGATATAANQTAPQPFGLFDDIRNRPRALNVTEKDKGPKEYPSATEGIEVENPVPFQVVLRQSKSRGVMAWVQDAKGEVLAEFTTDMGTNPFTIENRTTPCPSADLKGIDARKRALRMLAEHIEDAAAAAPTGLVAGTYEPGDEKTWNTTSPAKGAAVKEGTKGDLTLKLKVKNHRVVPKSGSPRPGVQITKGLGFSEMLAAAATRAGPFAHASWLDHYKLYRAHYVKKHGEPSSAAAANETTVFGMLGSLLHFYLRRLDFHAPRLAAWQPKEGVGGRAVGDDNTIALPDMSQPGVKNPWGLLPKTPPAKWLTGLDTTARARVTDALKSVPTEMTGTDRVNATAWDEIYRTVINVGGVITGHPVPDFKIAGETGFAFEIRTPKLDEKSDYGY